MHKIIYKNITIDDNMMLIVQALIDKQGESIDWINRVKKEQVIYEIITKDK